MILWCFFLLIFLLLHDTQNILLKSDIKNDFHNLNSHKHIFWLRFHNVNLIYNFFLQSSWHRVPYSKSSLLTFIDRQSYREFFNCFILHVVRVSNFFRRESFRWDLIIHDNQIRDLLCQLSTGRNMIRFYGDRDRSLLLVVSILTE